MAQLPLAAEPADQFHPRLVAAVLLQQPRETPGFSGDTTTHWQTHGPKLVGLRRRAFDGLIFTSRVFSKLAHIVDPNSRPPA